MFSKTECKSVPKIKDLIFGLVGFWAFPPVAKKRIFKKTDLGEMWFF